MKTIIDAALILGTCGLCGCGSIVVSTKETTLPKTSEPLTTMRYYLPKGRIQVTAKWDKIIPGWEPTGVVVPEADPKECYRLDRRVNALFDDKLLIAVNPNSGLLETADATSSDQTINAVSSIAAAVGAAFTFGCELAPAAEHGARGTEEEIKAAELAEFEMIRSSAFQSSFQVLVDTDTPTQTVYMVSSEPVLDMKLYAKYVVTIERAGSELATPSAPSAGTTKIDGIAVRIPVPYKLTVSGTIYKVHVEATGPGKPKTQGNEQPEGHPQYASIHKVFMLPDPEHTYFLPLARIPLVTSSTRVTLKDGMVQSLDRSRPSLVAAIAGVPKTILSALVPLPLQINQTQNVSASPGSTSTSSGGKGH